MDDITFEELMYILENPTRRRILELLSREVHYPLQISKILKVSQQAVAKQMKLLEEMKLVESVEEVSEIGPPRKLYHPTRRFTLTIDMGPNLFSAEMREIGRIKRIKEKELKWISDKIKECRKNKDPASCLRDISELVRDIDAEARALEDKRVQLLAAKDMILEEAYKVIENLSEDYAERRILYHLIETRKLSISELGEALELREKVIKDMLKRMKEVRII